MALELIPLTVKAAQLYVREHHRHHKAPPGGLFAVGCGQAGKLVGAAIIGRPVARMLNDGYTAEVTRLATDTTRNACSMLYGAAWRACRALGYRRAVTYILESECGASLRAAGWKCDGPAGGGSWSRQSRLRFDERNTERKVRFSVMVSSEAVAERLEKCE